jgi:carbonic anhydrase
MAGPGHVPIQHPFAVVLGCSDARVPTEMIFDCACNELFVVRVAGNIIGQEQLGSVDYAVEHLGDNLKLIVVLGHSQCGAVTAAVDAFLEPAEYLGLSSSHYLRAIVNALFPAVRGAVRSLSVTWGNDVSNQPGYRAALIECSVLINSALMASILRSEFGDTPKDRSVVFGTYDLASRHVHVSQPSEDGDGLAIQLMEAPLGRTEFRQFASQLASSAFISRLLHG